MPIPLGHAVTWRNVTVTAASGAAFNSCFVTRLIPPEGRDCDKPLFLAGSTWRAEGR